MKTKVNYHRQPLFMVLAVAFVITGCVTATYRSARFDLGKTPPQPKANGDADCRAREGTAYFLPKGYIHLLAELQTNANPAVAPGYKLTLDVTLVPDGSNMFVLQPQPSAWAHDTFGVTVQNGLLTSVGSTNVDQTGTALLKIAELAGVIATSFKASASTNLPANRPPRIELMFTPDDVGDGVNGPNSTLKKGGLSVEVKKNFPPLPPAGRDMPPVDAKGRSSRPGICYRPLLPYTVIVKDEIDQSESQAVLMLPNEGPILSLIPRRATLVTARTSIQFDHGCPTAFSFDRDSPGLAWVSLPLDMVKAFLSAPAELVQLKLNLANTNAQLSAAELNNLNNQLSLLKQQVALHQFMLTNPPAGGH